MQFGVTLTRRVLKHDVSFVNIPQASGISLFADGVFATASASARWHIWHFGAFSLRAYVGNERMLNDERRGAIHSHCTLLQEGERRAPLVFSDGPLRKEAVAALALC